MNLRELFVKLGLDWESSGFAQAIATVDLLEKGLKLAVDAVKMLADAFVKSVVNTATYGEEMEVLAQQTGFSVDAIQKLGYAASLSHSSAEEMRIGLSFLSHQVLKAKDGSDEAIKSFTQMGISMSEVRTLTPEQLFFRIADRMKSIGNQGHRSAYAMDLLGKSGVKLIPTLDRGADGLEAMGVEAEELNAIMTDGEVHAAATFKEGLEKLEKVFEGLQHMIAGPLIEALTPVVEEFIEWLKVNRDIIRSKLLGFMQVLVAVLMFMVKIVKAVVNGFDGFLAALKVLGFFLGGYLIAKFIILNALLVEQLVNFALTTAAVIYYGYVSAVAAAKAALAWAAAAAPVVLIAAALGIAALAAEDFYYFLTDGDSVLGALVSKWGDMISEWWKPKATDSPFIKDLKNAKALIESIILSVSALLSVLDPSGLFGKAMDRATAMGMQNSKGADANGVLFNGPAGMTAADFLPKGFATTPWAAQQQAKASKSVVVQNHSPVMVDARGATQPDQVGAAVKEAIQQVHDQNLKHAAAAAGID